MFSSPLTYDDFYRTGLQDCGNVLSIDEFDYSAGTPAQIVDKAWAEWESDGMEEQWLEQQDDLEGLDPHKCYESWREGWKSCARRSIALELQRQVDEEDLGENPPPGWWRKPAPTADRTCYRTKTEALKRFLDVNYQIVENYGGADYQVSPSEFDSINHKYDLTGKKAVRTIAQAVWAAMPVGKPYCLDRIDLDALNDTSPAREFGSAFVLPDIVYATAMAKEEARHYRDLPDPEEPVRIFPALPPLPDVAPMRVELEEQEPGVSTFKFSNPSRKFKVGDIVRRTAAAMRSMGVVSGPINGQVVGYSDRWPLIMWSDMNDNEPPMAQAEDGLELDRRAMGAAKKNPPRKRYREGDRVAFRPMPASYAMYSSPPAVGAIGTVTTVSVGRKRVAHLPGPGGGLTYVDWDDSGVQGVSPIDLVPERHDLPRDNPAWVTNILSKHYVQLEEQVPPQWLPKLTKTTASRGKITAAMKELGCGAYGCVLPTLDPKVVLKLTTDETEAQFAHELADKLTVPVVVKYHLTRALPERYKGRPSFLLWRDSADHVGKVEQAIAEEGGTDPTIVEEAIATQHSAAQEAYEALFDGEPAEKLLNRWEDAAREMGLMVPELRELAEGMITNLRKDKVFFGDVHSGNIGRVDGRWVVVDPGHVAVLEA